MIERTPIAVAYKLVSGKIKVTEFTDQITPDKIISSRSNLLPKGCEILDIGVGSTFLEKYTKKYLKDGK